MTNRPCYYFLKVGPGNSFVQPLLVECRLGYPAIAGFFRAVTLDEIDRGQGNDSVRFSRQAIELFRWASGEIQGYGVIVSGGRLWIVRPDGPMTEMSHDEFLSVVGDTPHADDVPKIVPVKLVQSERITRVPPILAHITSNRRLSSSTFKQIVDDVGTQLAIDHVLFKAGLSHSYPHADPSHRSLADVFACLADTEVIALVARLLEESDLAVPAPTGGFVRAIDLIAYNDRAAVVDLEGLVVPGRRAFRPGAVMIQVRPMPTDDGDLPPEVDYRIQVPDSDGPRTLDGRWLARALARSPMTREWLARITRWIPFSDRVMRGVAERYA